MIEYNYGSRNRIYYHEIVEGKYGRKVAYTDVDKITAENIVGVVGSCIGVFNLNKTAVNYLWNYVHGDQPILYREKIVRDDIVNKIVENHAYEIVQFKTGQTYGEPVQCVSRTDDKKISDAVDKFNDYLKDANKHSRDISSGEWQSAVGTSFKAVQYADKNDYLPFRIVVPTPMDTFIIYSKVSGEPMIAVQELKDAKGERYLLCYTKTHECRIVNSKVSGWKVHAFGGIPIVEYPNNAERISDVELVITMLDAINNMQSNRMDSIEQFVQSWIKFVNCEVDTKTFQEMKMQGALTVKSNNSDNKADVDIITQELNQTESQIAKDDLWNNVLSISAIPNKEGGTKGGDSQGAVELRAGWDFSKTRAKLKDPYVVESEKRLNRVILNVIRVRNGKNECPITERDYDITINHSPMDNLIVKCQALQFLLQCGVHPMIAFQKCGLFGDVEKSFLLSKPYLDNLYKVSEAVDVDGQTKKVELFMKCLNTGMNIEDSAKTAGLEISDKKANFGKWDYGDDA